MFHLTVETSLFNTLGDELVFSTFMRACFDFLGAKNWGGGGAHPLAPPHATALAIQGSTPWGLHQPHM